VEGKAQVKLRLFSDRFVNKEFDEPEDVPVFEHPYVFMEKDNRL